MIYDNYLSTFHECSNDDTNKEFLVANTIDCFNLDAYFVEKFKYLEIGDRPNSLDCIYSKSHNFLSNCLFVEFKNQRIKNIDELYSKVYNSVIIFISENNCSIEHCAANNFLLIVYRNYKEKISGHLGNLSNKFGKLKGLERFKKYCFKEVNFITDLEFDNYITEFDCLSNY